MSRAPTETQRAICDAVLRALLPLRADPPQTLSQWAARHFMLSAESSHAQGQWQAYPFQPGWMDAMSNDDIVEVTVRKSKRVGYTKTLLAFIAYNAAHRRRKQALWQPTDDDRDSFVKSEIDPMLRDVAAMRPVLLSGKEDTLKLKQFLGSVLHTLGGKAARAFRRITVDVSMLDEASAFDLVVEKSIDPVEGARGRLEGAPFPKLVAGSTPRVKGIDHIETREANADALMRYHIACPHCQTEHPLQWGGKNVRHGFKGGGLGGDTGPIRHHCPHCLESISQGQYLQAYVDGTWISECGNFRYGQDGTWRAADGQPRRPPRHVAFHIWAAYSPQREWSDIAREFIQAKVKAKAGENGPLITFVNETLGELWEEEGDGSDDDELQKRAEDYPLTIVPKGCLILTAGADLQGNRLELGVWGWSEGLESWDIDHVVIEMNPASDDDWLAVEQHMLRRYTQAWHGGSLPISAISIDSNYQTQAVYNFVRRMQARIKIYAIKGEGAEGLPIKGPGRSQDVNWRGGRWPNGVKQWAVGVDSAKDLLHGQLQINTPGPGFVHLNKARSREWFAQLTAEQRMLVRGSTSLVERWVKRRARNEVLDTRNYALHAAYMLGLHQYTHRDWVRLEAAVQPPPDLFTVSVPQPQPADDQTAAPAVAAPPSIVQPPPAVARRQAEPPGRHW